MLARGAPCKTGLKDGPTHFHQRQCMPLERRRALPTPKCFAAAAAAAAAFRAGAPKLLCSCVCVCVREAAGANHGEASVDGFRAGSRVRSFSAFSVVTLLRESPKEV